MTAREPGESWRRAMDLVAERHAAGSKKRYRVFGYKIDDSWWAYSFRQVSRPPHVKTEPIRIDAQKLTELLTTLPRCAQRARRAHGGGSKLAIPDERLARALAEYLSARPYRCTLPAPAIGEHWHLSSST